jgi:hypothetical protein
VFEGLGKCKTMNGQVNPSLAFAGTVAEFELTYFSLSREAIIIAHHSADDVIFTCSRSNTLGN